MTQAIIRASGLSKVFAKHTAVDNIGFEVYPGECLGLLGPNGAGKTTTLRMLLGQTNPTAGELTVLNYPMPQQARAMRFHVGVVPQVDNLDVDFSVIENLRMFASYFGLHGEKLEAHLQQLLAFAQLADKQHLSVNALSGGMKRRLILARALVNQPKLLILDEPTTGLDPQARQLLWQRLRTLKQSGATLILTTHYLEEAERLCDRLYIIDQGKILAEGSPKALIQQHIEPHVVEIYGAIDQLPHGFERTEVIGETVFAYCQQEQTALQLMQQRPQLEYLLRRANLDDVFLKLTGRELRDR